MALLEARLVNGTTYNLPTPSPENYQYQNTHLEDSYVDATGYLHRDIIRKNRAKVFCGWDLLNASNMSLLETLYDQDYFYLTCTDNHNNRVTKKVYAGPLEGKAALMNKADYTIKWRTKVQMNFIEY